LCYRAPELDDLGERERRGESEREKVARRAGKHDAMQRGHGSRDWRHHARQTQRRRRQRGAHARRAARLRARAMLMARGPVVRCVAGSVRSGGSRRDVVQRALVHLRPDQHQAEPQCQGGAQQASRPVPLHATRNLRDNGRGDNRPLVLLVVVLVSRRRRAGSTPDPGQPCHIRAVGRVVWIERR